MVQVTLSALKGYQQTFLTTLALLLFSAQITLKADDESNLYSDEELYEMLFRDTPTEPPNKKKIKWTPSYTFETGLGFLIILYTDHSFRRKLPFGKIHWKDFI